jgi:glycosyltransferase involved in cell wall biosynthesis
VIVICPELERLVRELDGAADPILIENAPGAGDLDGSGGERRIRAEFGIDPATPLAVYTGTFEAYQGLDLLFDAMARVLAVRPEARLLLAGGRPDQVAAARHLAEGAGVAGATIFAGERRSTEIPAFLDAADALVSPRSRGTNTPLKIYQYLRAGRAIVATRLLTHTQVLDDEVAILTTPDAAAFADGLLRALTDREGAEAIGARAARLAATKYSYEAYLERTRQVVSRLRPGSPAPVAGSLA